MTSSVKNRKTYLDALSVLSALAVVVMHCNGVFWEFSATESYWLRANAIECLFYFAVPVFFMISGVTLLDYQEKYNTKAFFKKRMLKAVVPFFAWSIIAVVYMFLFHHWTLKEYPIKEIILKILNSEVLSIYWFFITLFGIYLSIPVLAAVAKEKKKETYLYFTAGALLINVILPFVLKLTNISYTNRISFMIAATYLPYLTMGWLLDRFELKTYHRVILYVLGIAAFLAHLLGTYFLSMKEGYVSSTFKGYMSVPCVFYSAAIFLLVKNLVHHTAERKLWKVTEYLRQYTFGMYLIHWFIMDVIRTVFALNTKSVWYQLLAPLAICVIAFAILWIIKRIPVLKYIVP